MSIAPSARFAVSAPEVVHQTIDGEVVVINLARGFYYSLQASGAVIWEALASGATCAEVIDDLSRRFTSTPGALAEAVGRLVDELQAEGLIGPSTSEGAVPAAPFAAAPAGGGAPPPFEAPVLQKYSDMQQLLLLDPIHEVDESGWPGPDPGRNRTR